jgi:hypothetical protein
LVVEARCPRCGAELTADAAECPICAYGEVEEIIILEAQAPGAAPAGPAASPSVLPRVLAALAFLVVVIVVIFAAVR